MLIGKKYIFIFSIVLSSLFWGCPEFQNQDASTSTTGSTSTGSSSNGYLAIYGNIHYVNGQGIEGTNISVQSVASGKTLTGQTDSYGNYRISGLSTGDFNVTAFKNDNYSSGQKKVSVPSNSDVACDFVLTDKIIRAKRYRSFPGIVAMQLDFESTKIGAWNGGHVVELHCYASSASSTDNIPVNAEIYLIGWGTPFPSDSALQSSGFISNVKNDSWNYSYLGYVATSSGTPVYSSIIGSGVISPILNAYVGVIFIAPSAARTFNITTGPDGPSNGKFVWGVVPIFDY